MWSINNVYYGGGVKQLKQAAQTLHNTVNVNSV